MTAVKNIIFLCTGNSCRSPIAEGIARKIFADHGLKHNVSSYGTLDIGQQPPAEKAQRVCKAHGIDISGHRSHQLTDSAARDADIILIMENAHKDWISTDFDKEIARKAFLITEYGCDNSLDFADIPDPIGFPQDFYENIFKMLWGEINRIAKYECELEKFRI